MNTPLRPVLPLPGSSYYNLNKVLSKFFEIIEGANIETNSLESIGLEPNENVIILDVKSLYTNFPLKESKDIALRKLYEQDQPASIARKTMKRLLHMAVSQVHFNDMETCYSLRDGFFNGGIFCRYFSKSLVEAVRRFTIEGYSRKVYSRKRS